MYNKEFDANELSGQQARATVEAIHSSPNVILNYIPKSIPI